jgi:hypothetical protein
MIDAPVDIKSAFDDERGFAVGSGAVRQRSCTLPALLRQPYSQVAKAIPHPVPASERQEGT